MGWIDDFTADSNVTVLRERQGQGVLVDDHLDAVPGLFPTGLHVDDGGVLDVEHYEVGTAGQGGGLLPQPEGVLALNVEAVTRGFPFLTLPVQQRRVVEQPLCLVEVRGRLGPVPVVGLEPGGSLAPVFACQQAAHLGGPDVGVLSSLRHDMAPLH